MPRQRHPLPRFDRHGNLPPGIYRVSVRQIGDRLAWNAVRRRLCEGLALALGNLGAAGVRHVWIGGSFATSKDEPRDVDGCWEYHPSVDEHKLDTVFLSLEPPRTSMKEKYRVDFLIAGTPLSDACGLPVEEFLQIDRDGNRKGILLIELGNE